MVRLLVRPLLLCISLVFVLFACSSQKLEKNREVASMKLTSPAFADGATIPSKYTCDGNDLIPPLLFSDVPSSAQSLALVVDDPYAPVGVWDHWILWNLDPLTKEIKEGVAPVAVYGKTSFKRLTWGGPCPPDREHRYFFKLYALDTLPSLPEGSIKKELEQAMKGHIVAQAVLMGRYNRVR